MTSFEDGITNEVAKLLNTIIIALDKSEYLSDQFCSLLFHSSYDPLSTETWLRPDLCANENSSVAESFAERLGIESILHACPDLITESQVSKSASIANSLKKAINTFNPAPVTHTCSICSTFLASTIYELDDHLSCPHYRNGRLKTLVCSHCPFSTQSKSRFAEHMITSHKRVSKLDLTATRNACPNCSFTVKSLSVFYKHRENCVWDKQKELTNQVYGPEGDFNYLDEYAKDSVGCLLYEKKRSEKRSDGRGKSVIVPEAALCPTIPQFSAHNFQGNFSGLGIIPYDGLNHQTSNRLSAHKNLEKIAKEFISMNVTRPLFNANKPAAAIHNKNSDEIGGLRDNDTQAPPKNGSAKITTALLLTTSDKKRRKEATTNIETPSSTNHRLYYCKVCDSGRMDLNELRDHMHRKHNVLVRLTRKCEICNQRLILEQTTLQQHYETHLSTKDEDEDEDEDEDIIVIE